LYGSFIPPAIRNLRYLGTMRSVFALFFLSTLVFSLAADGQKQGLSLAFPPNGYQTRASSIFILGTAPLEHAVWANGLLLRRSPSGHFGLQVPLELGENHVVLAASDGSKLRIVVTRRPSFELASLGAPLIVGSVLPRGDISLQPGELLVLRVKSREGRDVSVNIGNATARLFPREGGPVYSDVSAPGNFLLYEGSVGLPSQAGDLGVPIFTVSSGGVTQSYAGIGKISVRSPSVCEVAQVIEERGDVRTGPGEEYSKLTPLPQFSLAEVTGSEGEWLRLDYGAWIRQNETKPYSSGFPLRALLGDVSSRKTGEGLVFRFHLSSPVPITVFQESSRLTLSLYDVEATTELLNFVPDALISGLDWAQVAPKKVEFRFAMRRSQWGYLLHYEGNDLILELNEPPPPLRRGLFAPSPLRGIKIVLDPGHGGSAFGAVGPDGRLEKDINLALSLALRKELIRRGAIVFMTRESDQDLSLSERVDFIARERPQLALSIHHNFPPDSGDPETRSGMSAYWYNAQARDAAVFLQKCFVKKIGAADDGIYWDNLALPRCTAAPTVLLELGFMSNPQEFEKIADPREQRRRATTLATAISDWFASQR
jgi:N-acetylmuramoyl-L-alanine amidase